METADECDNSPQDARPFQEKAQTKARSISNSSANLFVSKEKTKKATSTGDNNNTIRLETMGSCQRKGALDDRIRLLMGVYLQSGTLYVHLNKVVGVSGDGEGSKSCAKIHLIADGKKIFKHVFKLRHNTRDPVFDETVKVS